MRSMVYAASADALPGLQRLGRSAAHPLRQLYSYVCVGAEPEAAGC